MKYLTASSGLKIDGTMGLYQGHRTRIQTGWITPEEEGGWMDGYQSIKKGIPPPFPFLYRKKCRNFFFQSDFFFLHKNLLFV